VTPGPTSASARIQAALRGGKTPEQVVQDLVEGGLSTGSAERIVARVAAELTKGPAQPSPALDALPISEGASARSSLIAGAFWCSVGLTVTTLTYVVARPGGKFIIAYGAVAAGGAAFFKGVRRFVGTGQPFPWRPVFLAAAAPLLGLGLMVTPIIWRWESRRWARQAVEDRRLHAIYTAEVRRQEVLSAERAKNEAEEMARMREAEAQRTRSSDIERARKQLQVADQPYALCDALFVLEKAHATEAVPEMMAILDRPRMNASVRNCAASVLVTFGETTRPLEFFKECLKIGTFEMKMYAVSGFAKVGPAAAEVALPVLREALQSSSPNLRLAAVRALTTIGPLGEALLRDALQHTDPDVRTVAKAGLDSAKP
jgi:hypothetical protein